MTSMVHSIDKDYNPPVELNIGAPEEFNSPDNESDSEDG